MPELAKNIAEPTLKTTVKVALVGNPNSGKSTLFNCLTGLNQKTGNFPGVTVDVKTGTLKQRISGHSQKVELIDLPGTYSLNPKSLDEQVAFKVLCDEKNPNYPEIAVVVADASNLKRSLLLCSQVMDLKIPVILALNMIDIVKRQGIEIDIPGLEKELGIPVIPVNARKSQGVEALKEGIVSALKSPVKDFINIQPFATEVIDGIKKYLFVKSDYAAFIIACNHDNLSGISLKESAHEIIKRLVRENNFNSSALLAKETLMRYGSIGEILKKCIRDRDRENHLSITHRIDKILTHKVCGYVIFLGVLFMMFQAVFSWASYPMDLIELFFEKLSNLLSGKLPAGVFTDLLVNGILAGLSGIVVFVPQIALLFAFIAILEDTGYMARVSFIMDKLMRKFGLNGKSVIPLMSGVACAVPAIMSTRTIGNWKERIISIMVTPLMSCSARLPVYTLLISLAIPEDTGWFGFNAQGLVLMGLYLMGFLSAIGSAWVMKLLLKSAEKSYFIMELPIYRIPRWSNVGLVIVEKVRIFLFDAGKVIISISVVLWLLSSYAPGDKFKEIEAKYSGTEISGNPEKAKVMMAREKLEASYAGAIGKTIEPVIAPLGFDWKIGIALVTSFAAREVFVGTMATIYSVGDDGDPRSIRDKMLGEKNPITGEPKYSSAVVFSLLIFYAFAMQCMSTLAVVYRETRHWKWPLIQFLYMSTLAYLTSLVVFNLF